MSTGRSNHPEPVSQHLELRPGVFWALQAAVTLGYVAFCILASRRKPLWFDELFTMHVDRLGGTADVWDHVRAGMDSHPPLGNLLGNLSIRLFGFSPLTLRLPSMVAFGVATVAVYRFTARRAGQVTGLMAVVLLLVSSALPFAIEARGYALAVCFTALALWAYQSAGEPGRSPWSLIGLSASVTAAMWTHYYAVLLFIPLGVGEVVKTWHRRKVDWPVWLSLGAAALMFVPLYLLFVRGSASRYSTHFWAAVPSPVDVLEVMEVLFRSTSLPLIGLLVVALVTPRSHSSEPASGRAEVPAHEVATALTFFLMPAAMWVMAKLVTNAFVFRYVLFSVVGGVSVMALGISRLWVGDPVMQRRCAVVFLSWLPISTALQYRSLETHGPTDRMVHFTQVTAETLDTDVVFDNNFDYFQYLHYNRDPSTLPRVFHLMDVENQLRFNDDDTMARAFAGLQQFTDVHVSEREAFLRTHRRFVVISSVRFKDGWILPTLVEDKRATVTLIREEKPFTAYLVTYPES